MSEQWHDVISQQTLLSGQHHVLVIKDKAIAVFNLDGQFYAIEDYCPHQGLPLSDGLVSDHEIECPFHGARFCIKSGEVKAPPAHCGLTTYKTRIENQVVQVFI